MKVLLISHSYIHKAPRAKLRALGALPDVDLSVIVPEQWPFQPQGVVRVSTSKDPEYHLITLPTLMMGKEGLCIYVGLAKKLREIRPDIIHVEHGAAAFGYTQVLLLKRVIQPKAKTVFFTWWNLDTPIRFPLHWTEQFNLHHADFGIAGNKDAQQILRDKGFKGPIHVFPLWGIDPNRWSPANKQVCQDLRSSLDIRGDDFVAGYAGRFIAQKGLTTLVQSAGQLGSSAHVLLVGRGPLREELLRLARELGLGKLLHFVDTVPHSELVKYISLMDAFVLPSETTPFWREQFGHVLIEAMACETPVIGSDSGEIPNVIGDAGLIFREGDADDLVHKLQLLMDSPPLRAELATRGRQRVLAKYTHQRIAEEMYHVYQEMLE